jgi:hypothetical protein
LLQLLPVRFRLPSQQLHLYLSQFGSLLLHWLWSLRQSYQHQHQCLLSLLSLLSLRRWWQSGARCRCRCPVPTPASARPAAAVAATPGGAAGARAPRRRADTAWSAWARRRRRRRCVRPTARFCVRAMLMLEVGEQGPKKPDSATLREVRALTDTNAPVLVTISERCRQVSPLRVAPRCRADDREARWLRVCSSRCAEACSWPSATHRLLAQVRAVSRLPCAAA